MNGYIQLSPQLLFYIDFDHQGNADIGLIFSLIQSYNHYKEGNYGQTPVSAAEDRRTI